MTLSLTPEASRGGNVLAAIPTGKSTGATECLTGLTDAV